MKTIVVEHKKTGAIVSFTLDQWANLEKTNNHLNFRIIDSSGIVPEKIEPVVFAIETKDYRKLLIEKGIEFDKRIRSQKRLKEIYELT